METLTYEEISQAIHDYIRENYDFDYADIFEDELQYHVDNKIYTINITIESDDEE